MYSDSEIAAKQSTARTKATALINNVLAPHSLAIITETLKNVSFYGISTDASNHKSEKIFPLLAHYFTEAEGLQTKLLRLVNLPNETSEIVTSFCIETLKNLKIPLQNLVAFGADNTNTNFGGKERRGTNNIFYKLKQTLSTDIEGIGCPAHILHNAVSTATDVLAIDIESVVLKIYKYFSIFTVRTERLKNFCDNAEVVYSAILSHSRSRWLSLVPAIERIIKLWKPLKDFFAHEEKAPKVIIDFFNNSLAEVYTHFVHSQAFIVEKYIKKIEKNSISIIEVAEIINEIVTILKDRLKYNFVGTQTALILEQLKQNNLFSKEILLFEKDVSDFFLTITNYLQQWVNQFQKYKIFNWMNLADIPEWETVQKTIFYLNEKQITISDGCFEEVVYLKSFIKNQNEGWKEKNLTEKWSFFFANTEEKERKENLLKMLQYMYAIPAHNANVERVFSLMSSQWTKERNSLKITTIESILQCQYNLNMSCEQFYNYIKDKKNLLDQVQSTEKYDWAKPKNSV